MVVQRVWAILVDMSSTLEMGLATVEPMKP